MKLNLQMLSKIISLPVEKEHNQFFYENLFLDVQYFSAAV